MPLEGLMCNHCKGAGYLRSRDFGDVEGETEFWDVCAYCYASGSEVYTTTSMANDECQRQMYEMIEYVRYVLSQANEPVDDETYEDAFHSLRDEVNGFLESYDPERLAARAEERAEGF